jgi:2-polyprenyl-3-methyl-5-hydroxy-6-metoxy-1,4-benzoquinol methylase
MAWYNDWFNSENYLNVYRHRDESEAERLVNLIANNIILAPNSSVLDMACGAGRHAIVFAKMGFNVNAVDLSERLIAEAKKDALQNGVKIDFILSDILEYNPANHFDLVANLFTSIGYFDSDEENYAVIKKAYSLVKQKGYFILDYFNKDFLLKNIIPTTVFSEDGIRIIQNRSVEGRRIVKKINIEKNGSVEQFFESVRLYSKDEILRYINNSGFTIEQLYGDYFGNNYDGETSQRLIIFAKK